MAAAGGARGGVEDVVESQDLVKFGTGGLQAGHEGVVEVVVGSNEQDGTLDAGSAVGQGQASGDAGGKHEDEEGGAAAGGTIQEGEFAQRDALWPEPGGGLSRKVGEWKGGGLLKAAGFEWGRLVEGHGSGPF